ncbi:MAG: hypothetical protein ABFD54_07825 [Armatimonadota bacterium]|nr:hypothetical protein [bacterium]
MESGEFGNSSKGKWAHKPLKVLKWSTAIIGIIWFIVCQVCLSFVLLRTGSIPDLCDASVSLSRSENWALLVGLFSSFGGLAFGVIPVALVFLGITLATRKKAEYAIATTSKDIFMMATAFLTASFITLFWMCAPTRIPAPARVMLSGIGDIALAIALIYIFRKR